VGEDDLDALGKASGVDVKQLMHANQSNPADMVKALKGSAALGWWEPRTCAGP
jgi:hypothetical protein